MAEILTEDRIHVLVDLAKTYAQQHNLDEDIYVEQLLNVDKLGFVDPQPIIEILIRYHKEWLTKAK